MTSDQFVKTRIFRDLSVGSKVVDPGTRNGGYRVQKETELFSNKGTDFLGEPPKTSIYDTALIQQKQKENSSMSGWITVYCVPNCAKRTVIEMLAKRGDILRIERPPGNYLSVEYARLEDAKNVAEQYRMPVFINNKYAVSIKFGRHKEAKEPPKESNVEEYKVIYPVEEVSFTENVKRFLLSLIGK